MPSLVQGNAVPEVYERLVEPHIASFDYFLGDGMQEVFDSLEPIEFTHPVTRAIHRFTFESPEVSRPVRDDAIGQPTAQQLMPRDCREGGFTYKALFSAKFVHTEEGGETQVFDKRLGQIPLMVKSRLCHLRGLTRSALVGAKEEANEMGGYFICNGIERIVRMLIMQRRHYIMALRRSAYHKRGNNYTDAATLLRCVCPDQSSSTVRCHYLKDGTVSFAFTMRRSEYFIPAGLLAKCFLQVTDKEIYDRLVAGAAPGSGNTAFVAERAHLLLTRASARHLRTRAQCLQYLGDHFRVVLDQPARLTDHEIGEYLLKKFVFPHLESPADKLQLLLAMIQKLYALVNSACCEDNADALTHHEVLLPGHLLLKFMKEKLEDCLFAFRDSVQKDMDSKPDAVNFADPKFMKRHMDRMSDIGRKMEYFLNTGNLVSRSGLDISQATGFTVVAEKLNFFRYLSHFRSVHRGAYFAELRTTTVRKLLPESWGFMCPVHTPDGSPCGLLNHFAAAAGVVTHGPVDPAATATAMMMVLCKLGLVPAGGLQPLPSSPAYVMVFLDGKVMGCVRDTHAQAVVDRLRLIKVASRQRSEKCEPCVGLDGDELQLPYDMEVAYIRQEPGGPFPGIFIYTQSARFVRSVTHLRSGALECIGTLEQCYMSIRCPDGGNGGSPALYFTHAELHAGVMLSVVASMTPFSDYNQSPRNMYQCQMAKQTMGTPLQSLVHRPDGKLYRLQNPQAPLARTTKYDQYCMDEFPNGTNAVVAVLAYTGFDMEDAMILNKSSMERGLAHGTIYKTEQIDLRDERGASSVFSPGLPGSSQPRFEKQHGAFGEDYPQNIPSAPSSAAVRLYGVRPEGQYKDSDRIDTDGLPHVGSIVWPRQSSYLTVADGTAATAVAAAVGLTPSTSGRVKQHPLKGEEIGVVDQVTVVGVKGKGQRGVQRANIRMRYNRNPILGDKFASRHGQKGVLSILWPDVDMPYCASTGIRPDLIINPHAFPSRMTIGMLVESLVSKGAALKGQFVDASPFQRCDGKATATPVEGWGRYLEAQGFAKYGQETMISGSTGLEMPCDIYIGLVYYQRLRHMVSDKFQVRSTGPINNLTRQPVKGRKMGGGIRFGEMERDSLLAHGAAYLLHDRLHASSDYHVLDVCSTCGSLLAPLHKPVVDVQAQNAAASFGSLGGAAAGALSGRQMGAQLGVVDGHVICPLCHGSSRGIERVAMPYVFKYLATELACMNIKVSLGIS